MKIKDIQSVIISRTDAIGDVILTLPLCGLLKEKYPNLKIYFLGKSYTKAIIESCSHVYEFINVDTFENKLPAADAIIHVFPNKQIANLAKEQNIPVRIGTRNRLFHWSTCNHKIKLSRKNSDLHEAQLNIKLVSDLFELSIPDVKELWKYYGFVAPLVTNETQSYLSKAKQNLIFHPKSRGSAREWPIQYYLELLELLNVDQTNILLCGTEAEGDIIKETCPDLYNHTKITNLCGKLNLEQYIALIHQSDCLIACSTGPLHIAAASGIKAIGIYPSIRPIHAGRWAPIGEKAIFIEDKGKGGTTAKSDHTILLDGVAAVEIKKLIES